MEREEIFGAFDMWPDPAIDWVWADTHDGLGFFEQAGQLYIYDWGVVSAVEVKSVLGWPWLSEDAKCALVERFTRSWAV